jgi:hypothetical protein
VSDTPPTTTVPTGYLIHYRLYDRTHADLVGKAVVVSLHGGEPPLRLVDQPQLLIGSRLLPAVATTNGLLISTDDIGVIATGTITCVRVSSHDGAALVQVPASQSGVSSVGCVFQNTRVVNGEFIKFVRLIFEFGNTGFRRLRT